MKIRWLGAVTIPTALNAPPGMKWGCSPNDIFADTPLKRGTRYRFVVFAPVGTSDQDIVLGVDAAGFFGLDAKVGCAGWGAQDPKATGPEARCVEATYIGPETAAHVLCARAIGCWAGWGSAPPCKQPPPCEPGDQCFQPLPVPTTAKPAGVSSDSGIGGFLLVALAAVGLVAATLSISPGPAAARARNPAHPSYDFQRVPEVVAIMLKRYSTAKVASDMAFEHANDHAPASAAHAFWHQVGMDLLRRWEARTRANPMMVLSQAPMLRNLKVVTLDIVALYEPVDGMKYGLYQGNEGLGLSNDLESLIRKAWDRARQLAAERYAKNIVVTLSQKVILQAKAGQIVPALP